MLIETALDGNYVIGNCICGNCVLEIVLVGEFFGLVKSLNPIPTGTGLNQPLQHISHDTGR